jgi:hypothetical protein
MTLGDLFMFVSSKENILEKEKETKNGAVLPGCVAVHPLSPGMASS